MLLLRNSKAADPDAIPAEALKSDHTTVTEMSLFSFKRNARERLEGSI